MTEPVNKKASMDEVKRTFAEFCKTIAALRDPETGCPWDLEQDHTTLRRFMIEEAYEASHAMSEDDDVELCDELGDVLLQVVLNAQVAQDRGAFSIVDVVQAIDRKMKRRHPHVFARDSQSNPATVESVRESWDVIKANEAQGKPKGAASYFDGVKDKAPALSQAYAIGKKAKKINFDWSTPQEVLSQVLSEVDELKVECEANPPKIDLIREELGDVLFSLAQLSRHYGFDPELVAFDANRKFLKRFACMEALAKGKGQSVEKLGQPELEALWREAKRQEKQR